MEEKKEKNEKSEKKMLTFADIKDMFEYGMMNISSRTLDAAHAYKVVTFKTRLRDAYRKFEERRLQLNKDVGIEDGNKFNRRMNELATKNQRTEAEEQEFKENLNKNDQLGKLFNELLNDTCEIEPKRMPYDEWRKLQEENKDIKHGNAEVLALFDSVVEGILWEAPSE